ncbi:MAG: hypothetical protein GY928_04045 [Colwellia sp.]|nr:hypothetical protein [Colwellia sp.]
MTKLEKGIIVVILVLLATMTFTGVIAYNSIHEAGGVKHIIVEVGRDIKDISRQINEEPLDTSK